MKSFCRLLVIVLAMTLCIPTFAAPSGKETEKDHDNKMVDSGSFGVFQNGHRVGTETFSVSQTGHGSVIESEFKTQNAPTPAVQSSEMQLTVNGDIKRYEWKELSPGSAHAIVVPNDDFLTQKWSANTEDKEHDQPYLLAVSTSILDDYFFVHREILAWKFLSRACKQDKGLQCPVRQRTQFATMNPHQQSSASLAAEFLGREKVDLKSGSQDLIKIELKNDAGTWQLWLDDQLKVQRMAIVGDNTVIDRD